MTTKTHQLPLMSSPSNSESSSPSQNLSPPLHYHKRPTMALPPDSGTLQQIQQMAVHTANIVHTVSMFHSDDKGNNSDKECKRRGQVLRIAIQVFRNDNEAGDASPNILDSPLRAVHGHVLITGQHDQAPQVFSAGQVIVHSIV
jgi:hypothetical protein